VTHEYIDDRNCERGCPHAPRQWLLAVWVLPHSVKCRLEGDNESEQAEHVRDGGSCGITHCLPHDHCNQTDSERPPLFRLGPGEFPDGQDVEESDCAGNRAREKLEGRDPITAHGSVGESIECSHEHPDAPGSDVGQGLPQLGLSVVEVVRDAVEYCGTDAESERYAHFYILLATEVAVDVWLQLEWIVVVWVREGRIELLPTKHSFVFLLGDAVASAARACLSMSDSHSLRQTLNPLLRESHFSHPQSTCKLTPDLDKCQ